MVGLVIVVEGGIVSTFIIDSLYGTIVQVFGTIFGLVSSKGNLDILICTADCSDLKIENYLEYRPKGVLV